MDMRKGGKISGCGGDRDVDRREEGSVDGVTDVKDSV